MSAVSDVLRQSGAGYGGGGNYQSIMDQYGALQRQVQGTIAGVGQSQMQAIADQYAQAQGQSDQQLAASGLGNTTVRGSMNRGLQLDRSKAQTALQNQLAQLSAGYQSQLGMAQLGFQGQYFNQQQQFGQQSALQAQQMAAQRAQQGLMRGYGAPQAQTPGPFGTNGGFGNGYGLMASGQTYAGQPQYGGGGSAGFYNQYLLPQQRQPVQYVGNRGGSSYGYDSGGEMDLG